MAFESWRVSVSENNKSSSVSLVTTSIGAVVIDALKGNEKPVFIEAKSKQRIFNLFGYYSKNNPQVWDLVQYNNFRPVWVSAPNNGGTYSGAFVTKDGTLPFNGIKYSNQLTTETGQLGIGDNTEDTFTMSLPYMSLYSEETIDITVDGTTIVTSVTGAGTTETIASALGSGTLNTSTGALSFTFTAPPSTGAVIEISYQTDRTEVDFEEVPVKENMGTGNGLTLVFSDTLSWLDYYTLESVNILLNGNQIISSISSALGVETFTSSFGTGSLDTATGVVTFTFTDAPLTGDTIEVVYNIDLSDDAYFSLFNRSPQANDTGVQIEYVSAGSYFSIDFYQKDSDSVYAIMPESPLFVSIVEGTKDGFGNNIYIEKVFENHDYLNYALNTNLTTVSSFADDTTTVSFGEGSRGSTLISSQYTTGWDYFQDSSNYPADIFMDFSANSSIPAIFSTLRNSYQKYKSYILPLPRANTPSEAIATKEGYSISDRGIYFYYNWGKVEDDINDDSFYASLIGRVAVRIAVTDNRFNGDTVSWINTDGEHGGQIGGGILELQNSVTETEDLNFYNAGINTIRFLSSYGYIITGARTSRTDTKNDYWYIEHSRVADFIMSNIINQVLPPQLNKPNTEEKRAGVRGQCDLILSPLLVPPNQWLREYRVKCDSENNTDEVLARDEFLLEVVVKFTPNSRTIKFIFTNVGQTVKIDEV